MSKSKYIWFVIIPILVGIVTINSIFLGFLLWVLSCFVILISIIKPISKLGFSKRLHALLALVLVTAVPLLIYSIIYIFFMTSEDGQKRRLVSACQELFVTEISVADGLSEAEKKSTCKCYYEKFQVNKGEGAIEMEIDRWTNVVNLNQFLEQARKEKTEFDELGALKTCRTTALATASSQY